MLSNEDQIMADFMRTIKVTKAQLQGEDDISSHPGASRWEFKMGEPLVWPQLVDHLPTRMYAFHKWYMDIAVDGRIMFAARVQDHHYF